MRFLLPVFLYSVALPCACASGNSPAAPSPPPHTRAHDKVGETVVDSPSEHYRFETHILDSADGERRYKIQIGVPRAVGAAADRSTLYMLDGNAAIDTLTEDDLASLARRTPPVLVAIGYDVPTRNDVVSRAYDYTPPVYADGQKVERPVVRGHEGGGADIFLNFIENEIKPLVRSRTTAGQRDILWGHSYGGLFALHVLFTRPEAFSTYIVGDPSAWWHNGALIQEWQAFDKSRAAGRHVDILVGTKPRPKDRPPAPDSSFVSVNGRQLDPRIAVQQMAEGLREHGADANHQAFPQYGHGEMIRTSLERALTVASEP